MVQNLCSDQVVEEEAKKQGPSSKSGIELGWECKSA